MPTTAEQITASLQRFIPEYIADYTRFVTGQFNWISKNKPGDIDNSISANVHCSHYCNNFKATVKPNADYTNIGEFTIMQKGGYVLNAVKLEQNAAKYAQDCISGFVGKLAAKMGEVDNAQVFYKSGANILISGTVGGKTVTIDQQMIINCSSKGLLFNQFPARICYDGKAISEAKYKKLIAG